MLPPRIVATDLDGTLLDSTGSVSPRTRRALHLAREAGAEIVFVTARPPRDVDPIAETAGVGGTAICSNGAIVYDAGTREIVTRHDLDPGTAARIADTLAEALPGVAFAAETGHGVLGEPGYVTQHAHDLAHYREVPAIRDAGQPVVKLLAWSAAHAVDEMFTAAVAAVEGQAEVTHSGGRGLLEISAPGVTKAGTLAAICAARGVEPAEVTAFGDMPNDLAVLAFAGAGYAMANAHHLVLAAVERRTLSNDEHGVAVILERLYT
ncbi:Cof-type HAD-IIB family hydrolase [Nonomuraea cavernae]|uniref:Hydrolase n=1 Tax=Nonomuraea cavernae TaxID=2045107 RepID=A0A917ZDC8_9ACTN|nr:HAD family hydrolase [Nonomuraea cavernae]MCA2186658.1 Cof-type HAD-IIB family hydrolase [Nonomuraea cavernae]GGO79757.1 hydrolase [Nonomuraea cavernae]